jgi:hypothetical protein
MIYCLLNKKNVTCGGWNMELFDKNNNKKYSPEILVKAYENIVFKSNEGEYKFPDGDFFYISYSSSKEDIDKIIKNIFSDIYLINDFVQAGSNDYEIAGFNFNNNIITIEYWGKNVNTQFHVEIYNEKDKWYCTKFGLNQYVHPVCINDFPNGYDDSNFEKEVITEEGITYYKVLN